MDEEIFDKKNFLSYNYIIIKIIFVQFFMEITTILIISFAAVAIYITFLILGFALKGKNLKAQNLIDKKQFE